jgi:putative heme iron utilization protein
MSIARAARLMLRAQRYGALSTASEKFNGHPFGSITPFLADHDGSILVCVSALAEHTKNMVKDPRVSLVTHDQRDGNVQAQGRVTLIGHAKPEPEPQRIGSRYMRYFPDARAYLGMSDFAFYRIRPIALRYIAGFGQIHWVSAEDYTVAGAEAFAQQEEGMLAELNSRRPESLQRLMRQNFGIELGEMQAIGLDCDGLDVAHGGRTWRIDYPDALPVPSLDALLG